MTQNWGVFVWKTDGFHFLRSFFARCRSASSFKRFVSEIVPFSCKTDQICHCEEGAAFAPDAAIFNEAIFILFLPHLGACFALLPCLSSVFSKKWCFLKKPLDKSGKPRYNKRALRRYGRLAQLARASAWRAEGHRFESYIVHHEKPSFVNLTKEGFSMISVPVRTGDISSIWYRTFVRWYMPAAYEGTDIISCLHSKHIIRLAVYRIAIAIYHWESQRLMI